MATCSFIREKKQTAGAMGGVLRYVAQEQKTVDTDGTRYLTGINCAADLAYQSFLATKNLYGKARGTWFYHYVQSFPPQERVTPAEAHQIAQELAERFFPDCEVLVATHIDRTHLHSHLVVNSVKPDTGEKLHFTPRTLERMRLVSDQICREHGLTTLKPYRPKKTGQRTPAGGVPQCHEGTELEVSADRGDRGGHGAHRQPGGVPERAAAPGLRCPVGGRPETHHLHHPYGNAVPGRQAPRGKN